jgi:hypothetical protein
MRYRLSSGIARWTLAVLIAAQWNVTVLRGQSTFGTILGTVKDPASAVVGGAKVVVTNQGTNISQTVATDAIGNYEATHLNPGVYSVSIEAAGFQRVLHQNVGLETGQVLRLDVQMTVGSLSETISVTGQAPVVETETGTISDVRTGRQVRELPLNFYRGDGFTNGIWRYANLSPGVSMGQGQASYHGTLSGQWAATLDGTNLGDQGGNTPGPAQPSFESIQEVKLAMVNNSAEYNSVANMILISKSGTNELHGSALYQYASGGLNARNFFQSNRPFRVYNQFGGSIGGPVVLPSYNGRNRTFFFGAYEGNRDHRDQLFNVNVPSLAVREGVFSRVFNNTGNLIVIRDPSSNQPFPGNVLPRSRFSPVSVKTQEHFYLPPNFGPPDLLNQNQRVTMPRVLVWDHFDARLDHKVSNSNSMFARFSWRKLPRAEQTGDLPNMGVLEQVRRFHSLSVVDTHLISPTTVHEFRAGYAWHENPRWAPENGLAIVRELGIRGLTTTRDVRGVPNFTITGFTFITVSDFNRPQEMTYDLIDNITFIRGRHTMKVGFNLQKNQTSREPVPIRIFGGYDFTGAFSGFSYADFLLGIPQTTQRYSARGRTYGRNMALSGYIQDDYKVHPRLTLNLGLRYEWMNPFADRYGRMFNFDPATGNLVVPDRTVLERDVSPIYPSSIKIVTAEDAGFPPRGLRAGDGNNFDPRVGIAWRPFGHSRSVVRGGFGVYRNKLSSTIFEFATGGPFVSNETFTNRIVNGAPLFQFPEPFLGVGSLGSQDISAVDRNLFNAYAMQWNVTVEQEYASIGFRASYVATRSVNLPYRRNFNQPRASTVPFNNERRPFPQYRNITMVSNGADSFYNALQFEAERKWSHGLYFQAGWTWAKQLMDGPSSGDEGPVIENAYDRRPERGDGLQNRHRFIATYVWELPFGPGRRWLKGWHGAPVHIMGGWQIAGITVFQTGQRFTTSFTGRDPSNTNTVGGRPDRIANGNLPKDQRTVDRWFDATAFAVPPVNAGRFGNAGIGILEGPGTVNFSLSATKILRFKERGRVEFSVSASNAFNHPNFALPNGNISAPNSVGRVTGTLGTDEAGARGLLFGSRIEF